MAAAPPPPPAAAPAVAQFEAAATQFNTPATKPAAEAYLKECAASAGALSLGRDVLEGSRSNFAQFQAAIMIRDVSVRSWADLPVADRDAIRSYLMAWVVERAAHVERFVLRQVLQAVAVMWKRGWLGEDDALKATFFERVGALMEGDLPSRLLAVLMLQALVEEFGALKHSNIGMTLDFHVQSGRKFQVYGLPQVFSSAFSLLSSSIAPTLAMLEGKEPPVATGSAEGLLTDEHVTMIATTLSVLTECLSWDFKEVRHTGGGGGGVVDGDAAGRAAPVEPGAEWRDALLGTDIVGLLSSLYSGTRWLYDTSVPRLARQLLTQMCCLTGDVFPDAAARATMCQSLAAVLMGFASAPMTDGMDPARLAAEAASGGQLAASAGSEMVDMCTAWGRLVSCHGFGIVGGLPDFSERLGQLGALTVRLLNSAVAAATGNAHAVARGGDAALLGDYYDTEQTWAMEAVDLLLEAWVDMVTAPEVAAAGPADPVCVALSTAAGTVFEQLVQRRLDMAVVTVAAGIDDDNPFEDPSVLQDHMESAAHLARAAPQASVQLLATLLADTVAHLRGVVGGDAGAVESLSAKLPEGVTLTPEAAFSVVNEELFWLVNFSGYVLADACEGERPVVPDALNRVSSDYAAAAGAAVGTAEDAATGAHTSAKFTAVAADGDPVIALANAVFALGDFETQRLMASPDAHGMSPLLAQQVLWFYNRWASTYLMPDLTLYKSSGLSPTITRTFSSVSSATIGELAADSGSGAVGAAGGGRTSGEAIVDVIVQKASIAMALWSFEERVVRQATQTLMSVATSRTMGPVAVATPSYHTLLAAFAAVMAGTAGAAGNEALGVLARLASLPVKAQRALTVVLTRAAARAFGEGAQRHHFDGLVAPIAERLRTVCESPQFATTPFAEDAHNPLVLAEVDRLLQVLRGVVEASAYTHPTEWLWALAKPAIDNALVLMDGYCARTRVALAALQLMAAYLEHHLGLLPPTEAAQVYAVAASMVSTYAKHRGAAGASAPSKADEDETYRDIKALLRLLKHIVSSDDLDLGGAGAAGVHTAADTVFFGLEIMMPLMTTELLQHPKLCDLYLQIVNSMLNTYPERLAAAAGTPVFTALLHSLELGVQREERSATARPSLEALFSLASYHVRCAADEFASGPGFSAALAADAGLFAKLAQLILSSVAAPSYPSNLLSAAGNALLALALADYGGFTAMVESLLTAQADAALQGKLRDAFTMLMTANGVELSLARPNRQRFQRNMAAFTSAVRGVLVVK